VQQRTFFSLHVFVFYVHSYIAIRTWLKCIVISKISFHHLSFIKSNFAGNIYVPTYIIVLDQICKLRALGFSENDCADALERCNGQLDEAALWLTQNVTHEDSQIRSNSPSAISFDIVEVRWPNLFVWHKCHCVDI